MRWQVVCALVAVAQPPSRGRAAFESCDDAFHYAHNSGRLIVGQAFARLACEPARLPAVHAALLRAIELQVLRTSDSDPEKLCFYDGLWAGAAEQLGQEYARCAGPAAFGCVPRELLASFSPGDIDGSENRIIELKLGQRELSLPGLQYLLDVAMPNFYFHMTTAYDILRHNGVPLGKRDFLVG